MYFGLVWFTPSSFTKLRKKKSVKETSCWRNIFVCNWHKTDMDWHFKFWLLHVFSLFFEKFCRGHKIRKILHIIRRCTAIFSQLQILRPLYYLDQIVLHWFLKIPSTCKSIYIRDKIAKSLILLGPYILVVAIFCIIRRQYLNKNKWRKLSALRTR